MPNYAVEGGKLYLAEALLYKYPYKIRCPGCIDVRHSKHGFNRDSAGKATAGGLARRSYYCAYSFSTDNKRSGGKRCPKVQVTDFITIARDSLEKSAFDDVLADVCRRYDPYHPDYSALQTYTLSNQPQVKLKTDTSSLPLPKSIDDTPLIERPTTLPEPTDPSVLEQLLGPLLTSSLPAPAVVEERPTIPSKPRLWFLPTSSEPDAVVLSPPRRFPTTSRLRSSSVIGSSPGVEVINTPDTSVDLTATPPIRPEDSNSSGYKPGPCVTPPAPKRRPESRSAIELSRFKRHLQAVQAEDEFAQTKALLRTGIEHLEPLIRLASKWKEAYAKFHSAIDLKRSLLLPSSFPSIPSSGSLALVHSPGRVTQVPNSNPVAPIPDSSLTAPILISSSIAPLPPTSPCATRKRAAPLELDPNPAPRPTLLVATNRPRQRKRRLITYERRVKPTQPTLIDSFSHT